MRGHRLINHKWDCSRTVDVDYEYYTAKVFNKLNTHLSDINSYDYGIIISW